MCNLFVMDALISVSLSCFFIGRIETVYHFIPVQCFTCHCVSYSLDHERLSSPL